MAITGDNKARLASPSFEEKSKSGAGQALGATLVRLRSSSDYYLEV